MMMSKPYASAYKLYTKEKHGLTLHACMHAVLNAFRAAVPLRVTAVDGKVLLTKRQEQLVGLVAEGMSNREIAHNLRLSQHTVKNYLFRIFDKLGVSSRAELIIYAFNQQRPSS
jgi:DNA-binding NarL/FixJ family response regulator